MGKQGDWECHRIAFQAAADSMEHQVVIVGMDMVTVEAGSRVREIRHESHMMRVDSCGHMMDAMADSRRIGDRTVLCCTFRRLILFRLCVVGCPCSMTVFAQIRGRGVFDRPYLSKTSSDLPVDQQIAVASDLPDHEKPSVSHDFDFERPVRENCV